MATTRNARIAPAADFDVDVEIEKAKAASKDRKPFTAEVAGRTITFTDPRDLDWQILLEVQENPLRVLRYCLSDEDRAHLRETKGVPSSVFGQLITRFRLHYGIAGPEEAEANIF